MHRGQRAVGRTSALVKPYQHAYLRDAKQQFTEICRQTRYSSKTSGVKDMTSAAISPI